MNEMAQDQYKSLLNITIRDVWQVKEYGDLNDEAFG